MVLGTIGYVYGTRSPVSATATPDEPVMIRSEDMTALAALRREPHLVFRNMSRGPEHGALAFASLEQQGRRYTTTAFCQRVYFRAGTGLCLTVEQRPRIRERGYLFDDALAIRQRLDLQGVPSRARVSPDGRVAAFTVFVRGDSYAKLQFSTRTRLLNSYTGQTLADLEDFEVLKNGARLTSVDFNYWGVTFSHDGVTFYATLGTNGQQYLVRGNMRSRQVDVLRNGVECPSLSPDEQRIAFKQAASPGSRVWRPAVLRLSDLTATALPETRSVDDQIEWLDDAHVLYGIREELATIVPDFDGVMRGRANIWMLAADGTGSPQLFLEDGESPAVVRH
jgi:hypothetical protein